MTELDLLKRIYNLDGKSVGWAVIEETTRDESKLKPGLFIKGSRVYVDLFARRLYSTVDLPDLIKRRVYAATYIRVDDGMIVLEAKDDKEKYIVLPRTFIADAYNVTIYSEWMEGRLLL